MGRIFWISWDADRNYKFILSIFIIFILLTFFNSLKKEITV